MKTHLVVHGSLLENQLVSSIIKEDESRSKIKTVYCFQSRSADNLISQDDGTLFELRKSCKARLEMLEAKRNFGILQGVVQKFSSAAVESQIMRQVSDTIDRNAKIIDELGFFDHRTTSCPIDARFIIVCHSVKFIADFAHLAESEHDWLLPYFYDFRFLVPSEDLMFEYKPHIHGTRCFGDFTVREVSGV